MDEHIKMYRMKTKTYKNVKGTGGSKAMNERRKSKLQNTLLNGTGFLSQRHVSVKWVYSWTCSHYKAKTIIVVRPTDCACTVTHTAQRGDRSTSPTGTPSGCWLLRPLEASFKNIVERNHYSMEYGGKIKTSQP
jgi:hypothetical protein